MSKAPTTLAILSGATSIVGDAIQRELTANKLIVAKISRNFLNTQIPTDLPSDVCADSRNTSIQSEFNIGIDLSKKLTEQNSFAQLKDIISAHSGAIVFIHTAPIWLLPDHIETLYSLGVKRIIAFSSSSIEGKSNSTSQYEQTTIHALQNAENKCLERCTQFKMHVTIFRPTMIYGYGKGANISLIAKTVKKIHCFPVVTNAYGLRRPVHVDDLAKAVTLAMFQPQTYNKTYNLSGGEEFSYLQMVQRIIKASNTRAAVLPLPAFLYRLGLSLISTLSSIFGKKLDIDPAMATRMREHLNFDSTDAKIDFNYSPNIFLPNGKLDLFGEAQHKRSNSATIVQQQCNKNE